MANANRSTSKAALTRARNKLTTAGKAWGKSVSDASTKVAVGEVAKKKQVVACLEFTQLFAAMPEDFLLDENGDLASDAVFELESGFWAAKDACKATTEATHKALADPPNTLTQMLKDCTRGIKDRKTEFMDALNYLDVRGVKAFRDSLADPVKREKRITWKDRCDIWASVREELVESGRNVVKVCWGQDVDPETGEAFRHGPYWLGHDYKATYDPKPRVGGFTPPGTHAETQEFEYVTYDLGDVEFEAVVGEMVSGFGYLECGRRLAHQEFEARPWISFRKELVREYRLEHGQYAIRDQRPAN